MVKPKITFALLPPFCPHMQPCPSERIIRRFTAQTTDYQRLLSTFAEGLYTEVSWLLPEHPAWHRCSRVIAMDHAGKCVNSLLFTDRRH